MSLLRKRWIGASINSLLPVAQLGGEFVRARLLARSGTAGAAAGASVVVDLTAGLMTQALFAALGLVLLLHLLGHSAGLRELAIGLALFGLLLAGFVAAQRHGLFALLARPIARLARGPAWQGLAGGAAALDAEIVLRYRQGAALARCAGWRGLGWLAGGLELWLAFLVLGRPVELAQALALESLGQAVRSMGFLIPGGLGVQEGGILWAASGSAWPPRRCSRRRCSSAPARSPMACRVCSPGRMSIDPARAEARRDVEARLEQPTEFPIPSTTRTVM